jgi:hypothetical protein
MAGMSTASAGAFVNGVVIATIEPRRDRAVRKAGCDGTRAAVEASAVRRRMQRTAAAGEEDIIIIFVEKIDEKGRGSLFNCGLGMTNGVASLCIESNEWLC